MKGFHVLLLAALIPLEIKAGSLEIGQWLPWEMIEDELVAPLSDLHYSGTQNNLSLSYMGLTPKVSSINWKVDGAVQDFSLRKEGLTTKLAFGGEIVFTNLSVDQVVVMESGGNEIRVRVKASCTPIRVVLSKVMIDLAAKINSAQGQLHPSLSSLGLSISQFSLAPFTCSGIGGLNTEIMANVRSMLQRHSMIESYLRNWIAPQLPDFWEESFMSFNESLGSDFTIRSLEALDSGLLIRAELPLKSSANVSLPSLENFASEKPQLILTHSGFSALLSEQILSSVPDNFDLQNIKAFADLMKSRFQQYLVWPDLRRFPSDSPFPLSVGPEHQLSTLQDKNQWKGSLKSNGVLRASIGGAPIDYINFGFVLNTTFSVAIKDSVLTVKTGKATFDFLYSFGALYQMLFTPNPKISVGIFKTALASVFSDQTVDSQLPTLKLHGKEWKLQNWQQRQDIITMDWEE